MVIGAERHLSSFGAENMVIHYITNINYKFGKKALSSTTPYYLGHIWDSFQTKYNKKSKKKMLFTYKGNSSILGSQMDHEQCL
jgi:hypothetical protein